MHRDSASDKTKPSLYQHNKSKTRQQNTLKSPSHLNEDIHHKTGKT